MQFPWEVATAMAILTQCGLVPEITLRQGHGLRGASRPFACATSRPRASSTQERCRGARAGLPRRRTDAPPQSGRRATVVPRTPGAPAGRHAPARSCGLLHPSHSFRPALRRGFPPVLRRVAPVPRAPRYRSPAHSQRTGRPARIARAAVRHNPSRSFRPALRRAAPAPARGAQLWSARHCRHFFSAPLVTHLVPCLSRVAPAVAAGS